MRVGFGYDVHRLAECRRLVLGGVDIPFAMGLQGHSDADVLVHALCDALLGAAALGDIGTHFPDTDPAYRGVSSLALLEKVCRLVRGRGLRLGNADITVVAQAPKLAPFIREMRRKVSRAMGEPVEKISIKATTTEGLGFTGREQGIAAYAVACLLPLDPAKGEAPADPGQGPPP